MMIQPETIFFFFRLPVTSWILSITTFLLTLVSIQVSISQRRSQNFGLGGAVGQIWQKSPIYIKVLKIKCWNSIPSRSSFGFGAANAPLHPSGYATEFHQHFKSSFCASGFTMILLAHGIEQAWPACSPSTSFLRPAHLLLLFKILPNRHLKAKS